MLNSDQQSALLAIRRWWRSPELYMVVDGAGGTGKSYLLDEAISGLNCCPMFLCPTHEALKQLKDKVRGDYLFKTIHSALGLAPTTHEEDIIFEQMVLPAFWDDHNLIVVDECSMIGEDILRMLMATRKKIIFVGHDAQLPPVKLQRSTLDKCISPVFLQGFNTVTLGIPMRNTGALWDFNKKLEKQVYKPISSVPSTFDISVDDLEAYCYSEEGKTKLYNGKAKFALWSNAGVDTYNSRIRSILFGDKASNQKYLQGDKILLTSPITVLNGLDIMNDKAIKKISNSDDLLTLFANTKAEVISSTEVVINLNKDLSIKCYKIRVICEEDDIYLYEPKNKTDIKKVSEFYKHIAFGKHNAQDCKKAFQFLHFMLSLFSDIKHSYAMTSHRLQGSSVDTVIVVASDIDKNKNMVERAKCRYVACSRAMNTLMYYRGT